MNTTDAFTTRRLLYKCDNSITKVYSNLFKLMSPQQSSQHQDDNNLKYDTVKELEAIIFQIFKYNSALLSLQKEMLDNNQQQVRAQMQVEKSKDEIKKLMDEVKFAEVVRKRKLEYNEIAKSVREFDTCSELDKKIKDVETQVEKLNTQYQQDIDAYAEKERLLRMALSALRALKSDEEAGSFNQSPISQT